MDYKHLMKQIQRKFKNDYVKFLSLKIDKTENELWKSDETNSLIIQKLCCKVSIINYHTK